MHYGTPIDRSSALAVIPHSIDIVVADMAASLAFYRDLGLPVPPESADEAQVGIETPGGATIGLLAEAMMRQADPDWVTPIGQRVTFACRCDDAGEVDRVYASMVAAGHAGRQAPWDSPWGQRYAMLSDPDGNRVDLLADAN
jgi:catechol 2,3-dioxygenase-like lactoylglutathione lyase family enzyme